MPGSCGGLPFALCARSLNLSAEAPAGGSETSRSHASSFASCPIRSPVHTRSTAATTSVIDEGKSYNLHGHAYVIHFTCEADSLDPLGQGLMASSSNCGSLC